MCGLPDLGIAPVAAVWKQAGDVCRYLNGGLLGAFPGPLDGLLLGLPSPPSPLGSPIEATSFDL